MLNTRFDPLGNDPHAELGRDQDQEIDAFRCNYPAGNIVAGSIGGVANGGPLARTNYDRTGGARRTNLLAPPCRCCALWG